MTAQHSVFIVDEDPTVRERLLHLVRGEGYRARAFASAGDFLQSLPNDRSACVITEMQADDDGGVDLVQTLKVRRGKSWPVIVIAAQANVPIAVRMMKAGVADFIEKPVKAEHLLESVRDCMASLADLDAEREAQEGAQACLDTLTPRERQVFDALIDGSSNKQIAQMLEISPRTVEIFRAKVMTKMRADSLSALVRLGLRATGG